MPPKRPKAPRIFPFERDSLVARLGLKPWQGEKYLAVYLHDLGAKTVVVEAHYVDRHYLDEFSTYYARSFQPPFACCKRAHFFACPTGVVVEALRRAAESADKRGESEATLQDAYLGFSVLRPLTAAVLGRTVLRTYPSAGRRRYQVARPYPVHIGAVRLEVSGLAFQQQDGGAAVCASTALWSALQRVAYVSGKRSPTPASITEAAGSPFPASHGLSHEQMAAAISRLDYIADQVVPLDNGALFRATVATALRSHLPVILLIERKRDSRTGRVAEGHAVTLTGYSEPQALADITSSPQVAPMMVRTASLRVVYVHDDNLGSHAHYELLDRKNGQGVVELVLRRGRSASNPAPDPSSWVEIGDEWRVSAALIPKPKKLRFPVQRLLLQLLDLRVFFERHVFPLVDLHYDARFSSGVAPSVLGPPEADQIAACLPKIGVNRAAQPNPQSASQLDGADHVDELGPGARS